jgi:uncharacterized membrane-anchored protein
MTMAEHPLRRQLVEEMHLRRWPELTAPMLVLQVLWVINIDGRPAEAAALAAMPPGSELDAVDNPRHTTGTLDHGISFVMERHSEASAITLFGPMPADPAALPAQDAAFGPALSWVGTFPGEVIRATRILILDNEQAAQAVLGRLHMATPDLVSCHVGPVPLSDTTGGLRLWSNFRIGPANMGCLVLAAGGLTGGDLARVVQRLQELGNYRNLALLGLPVAQQHWNDLNRIEQALARLSVDVARPENTDNDLLDKVSTLSLELMAIGTSSSFRMSATAAYARLVEERLADLAPRPVPAYPSLADFTQRRLLPAVRTCTAHVRREAELSLRADRFAALLRTRIETRIENQNVRLLRSMERSAATQLRLQQLVEGFSVVALSYYGLALASYVVKGIKVYWPGLSMPLVYAALVPVMLGGMWLAIHHLKRRVLAEHDH